MKHRPLDIALGASAAAHIAEHGWRGADIDILLGASGGPKWLILGHLDRLLFGAFLLEERHRPLRAIGSSVGSWRHACLAQDDPIAAIERFEDVYVHWDYGTTRPTTREVSDASLAMLERVVGDAGARAIVSHELLHSYIVTARGRGLNSLGRGPGLAAGMGAAALANALGRQLLASQFQRVLFCTPGAPPLPFADFATLQVELSAETVPAALHASGSIPFLLHGERDLPGGPEGHYWDGGIIDYHFNPSVLAGEGLILYPHFRPDLTPGWFDKFLPWRRYREPILDNLILISPSRAFLASLPCGKIPDRSDFRRMNVDERIAYWEQCVLRSRELADDFHWQLQADDPLAGTRRLASVAP
jgi:hypothetical protein